MKIEKLNENQIRCTLTREDLINRNLKLSELAYGSEKAKLLFRDMMRQANFEFGFEAEDIPLMIEAIPLNSECIVLVITKVEDPEELDTRFARFAPSNEEYDDEDDSDSDDRAPFFGRRESAAEKKAEANTFSGTGKSASPTDTAVFCLRTMQQVMTVCSLIAPGFNGCSSLYKSEKEGYYLVLEMKNLSDDACGRICNIVSEYGTRKRNYSSFLTEHSKLMVAGTAVQSLSGN